MWKPRDVIYAGISRTVLALDRSSGIELWRARLKGSDFVGVTLDGDRILAATKGEIYCLDSATGQIVWKNNLKGLGTGLVTVASAASPAGLQVPPAEQKRRDDAANAAVIVTG